MPLDAASANSTRDLAVEAELLFAESFAHKPSVRVSQDAVIADADTAYAPRRVLIENARLRPPSLDVQGFELTRRPSDIAREPAEEALQLIGRAEAADLVSDSTGASRVHVFDHTVRRASPDAPRQPSMRVHNDYTAASAAQRVRDLLGAEADALLRKPYAFVNVWRPLRRPAIDWPLALCDARSVGSEDLVATDLVYPDRRGEIYCARWSPGQRWFYFPEVQLEEALLIKCYDSRPDRASFTPHTSFRNPLSPPGTPPRESVEFRAIAFFD
jgi:hypothetical protein